MPMRMAMRCAQAGCARVVRGGRFCEAHAGARALRRGRRSRRERGYDAAWMRLAALRRRLDAYLCQACLERGRLTPARVVDHIVPVHVRPDWRLCLENTQVLCPRCHQRKSAADSRRYGSSSAGRGTPDQARHRRDAQARSLPPRQPAPGGGHFLMAWRPRDHASPARVFPRNWVGG